MNRGQTGGRCTSLFGEYDHNSFVDYELRNQYDRTGSARSAVAVVFFMRNHLSPLLRIPNLCVAERMVHPKEELWKLESVIESCAVLLTWPHAWVVSAVELPNAACGCQSLSTSNYVVLEPNRSDATDCLTLE
jgi:hypothetical protein